MPPARLNTSIPFRCSRLAVPPSPFSPRSPINPTSTCRPHYTVAASDASLIQALPPPARNPMHWLWQCHICNRTYQLGVTRRCLDDGHYFCSGTSTIKRRDGSKRHRRHRACGSEFDYQGWKDWGVWRRKVIQKPVPSTCSSFDDDSDSESDTELEVQEIAPSVVSPITPGTKPSSAWSRGSGSAAAATTQLHKNCWRDCDYPSQCRWGKEFGVPTPVTPVFPVLSHVPSVSRDVEMTDAPTLQQPATDFESILTPEQQLGAENVDAEASGPGIQDLADLVTRARRRRSGVGSSPLAVEAAADTQMQMDEGTKVEEPEIQMERSVKRSGSRDTLRRAYEGLDVEVRRGIGALVGMVGGWTGSVPGTGTSVDAGDDPQHVEQQIRKLRRRSSVG